MHTAYRLLLQVHVVLGAIALAAFWAAVAARKGSRLHLRAGRTYVAAMSATAVTALALGALALADPLGTHPPEPGLLAAELAHHVRVASLLIPAIGLGGLPVLVLVHFGARAPARARLRSRAARALDWAAPGALLALGVAGIPLGRIPRLAFADGMGVACVALALPMLAALARARPGRPWIRAHLAGLGGASVIGHVAVFVSVIPRIAPALWSRDPTENPLPWIAPPVLGCALLAAACLRYGRRFRRPGSAAVL
jgi:hypothetical protein